MYFIFSFFSSDIYSSSAAQSFLHKFFNNCLLTALFRFSVQIWRSFWGGKSINLHFSTVRAGARCTNRCLSYCFEINRLCLAITPSMRSATTIHICTSGYDIVALYWNPNNPRLVQWFVVCKLLRHRHACFKHVFHLLNQFGTNPLLLGANGRPVFGGCVVRCTSFVHDKKTTPGIALFCLLSILYQRPLQYHVNTQGPCVYMHRTWAGREIPSLDE